MARKVPSVAIVGRTNVGKSTLFNSILRRRLAIVEGVPGVTRDRHYALVKSRGAPFTLIDTGGLVGEEDSTPHTTILTQVRAQTQIAINECDLALVVFDGMSGPHALDFDVVDELRKAGKEVIWVVNKCERPLADVFAAEFYALGLDDIVCVSATHHMGIEELVEKIAERLNLTEVSEEEAAVPEHRIRVAVIGRPNVGKSSLVNRIIGEERLVVSDVPGTTRDAIDIEVTRDGRDYVFVDTAGLRKKSRVDSGSIERFGNLRTLRALAMCDVAVLVLDATQGPPSDQEKKIAELIHERGRGFIIAVNKWDAVEKDHKTVKEWADMIYHEFPFAQYAPIVFISALTGRRCPWVLEKATEIYDAARVWIPTSDLNNILSRIFSVKPPPVIRGEPVKLFFGKQVAIAPPSIVLFLNYPKELQPSYLRYVKTHLRKTYPFTGVDIKLELRKRTSKSQREIEGLGEPETLGNKAVGAES